MIPVICTVFVCLTVYLCVLRACTTLDDHTKAKYHTVNDDLTALQESADKKDEDKLKETVDDLVHRAQAIMLGDEDDE